MADPFVTVNAARFPIDLAKCVAKELGQSAPLTLTDPGKLVELFNDHWQEIRQSELRRNVWRFAIKRAALRPMDMTTRILIPPAWSATTGVPNIYGFYLPGSIVSYNGMYFICNEQVPNSDVPGSDGSAWQRYFGPITVSQWDTTGKTTYYPGELVYKVGAAGASTVFMALQTNQGGASADPAAPETWDATKTYNKYDTIVLSGIYYLSTIDFNLNNNPTVTGWAAYALPFNDQWNIILGATLEYHHGIYPIGSGPASQTFTRNVYMLPFGFLRQAPEDPKAGSVSILGSPSYIMYRDYTLEGVFIVTRESQPILFRYVADVDDIALFDTMFYEGLSLALAVEFCEAVTQSTDRISKLQQRFNKTMSEARIVNGIETGTVMPPVDDWISCRL